MQKLMERLAAARRAVAFTGAGVSTLCGIPDFRGPQGLYRQPDADRIFDIEWFRRDPAIYYRGCRELIYGLRDVVPGPVHHALARLERRGAIRGVITQNIDMLHQKAGAGNVLEIHGSPQHRPHPDRCSDKRAAEHADNVGAGSGHGRSQHSGDPGPSVPSDPPR